MSAAAESSPELEVRTEGESEESFGASQCLWALRDVATEYDPRFGHVYRRASPVRIAHGVGIAQRLIRAHLRYKCHHRPGRGRRSHSRAVFGLLDGANRADLVLTLAALDVALGVLPRGTRDD